MHVAVTGANGFIGTALVPELERRGHVVTRVGRDEIALAGPYEGAEAVIHLAGLAHRTGADAPDAAAFAAVNTQLPLTVYAAARAAAVSQVIHVSTVHVLSGHEGPLREDMSLAPTTEYDRAKAAAERLLLAEGPGPALTIVRPTLVYGPGAKGNLRRLMKLCRSPMPLPFGSIRNRRTMVGLSNLCDALIFLLRHPGMGIVHAADGRDVSLRELVSEIRAGYGRRPGLLPFPPMLLRRVMPERMAGQLLDDQRVEMTKLPGLGWRPPHPPPYDLRRMAQAYG